MTVVIVILSDFCSRNVCCLSQGQGVTPTHPYDSDRHPGPAPDPEHQSGRDLALLKMPTKVAVA